VQTAFLGSLTSDELNLLSWYWPFWARKDQLPPTNDWSTWLLLGGRGSGKTRAGAEWVRMRVSDPRPDQAARHIALVGETLGAARAIKVEGPSGILAISPPYERPKFISSRHVLLWPNGAQASLFSSARPHALRGPQFDAAWCDEVGKWRNDQMTWDMLQFGLRLGRRPQQVLTTTPRDTQLLRDLIADPNCIVTKSSTRANRANLAPQFLRDIIGRYEGSRLGRQEIDAEMLDERSGGLWTPELIERQRRYDAPAFKDYILSLDPAIGAGKHVDHCGLIVLALSEKNEVYVIADETRQGQTPLQWSRHVSDVYRQYKATRLVAEVNQGGELVREVILRNDPAICFSPVRAHRNKLQRAYPVVALYERGLVFHLGHLSRLEEQMCHFDGAGASPDRLDALVWGVTDLLLKPRKAPHLRAL
jgi:phage terminase large subunit-like protein